MAIEKILNKRSNAVVTDGGGVETPKKPTSSQLDNGEIAVNYHKGTERIFIKNDNEEVIDFISKDNIVTLLATKQDTIDDLAAIRSGAQAGATAVQPADIIPIDNRLEDVEEALTETLPVESFIMDDYSIGSETIIGTNISSNGTVPIKECRLPYVSEPTITIDNVTYSKAIRKDFTTPYTDGVLAEFDFEEKGTLMVYYGFGGGGSYGTYYLQFYFTSDDGTITNELLTSRDVFDTAREIGKLSITIPKKGTLTIKAWDRAEGILEDNGYFTNIVRMDFTATPLVDVSTLKTTKANKSEMSVVTGTGADADKTTITLKQGTSATVLTAHQDISAKEDITNKVTSWQATPDDTHYPSEKLVKDSVDAVDKVFVVEYGVTTYAEVTTALNNDKSPVFYLNDVFYFYSHKSGGSYFFTGFASLTSKRVYRLDSNSAWAYISNMGLEETFNKQSSIIGNETSTTKYASTKAVADYAQKNMEIIASSDTTLSAVVGNYYRLDNVGTLTITLPSITETTNLQAITFLLVCGSNALVTFVPQGSETILYQEDFALEADTTYEVTALWNGSEWTLSRVIYE